ncbi:DUF4468 domain-containing protein [Maribacter sp. MMG018]|uniref:DUF4468 domain-containing protein n=1 Tax=Maribacter sp. MMG018 TaxID=2822688 RepID=UPI001B3649D1|nr:DUF4468 domain-containing protein [Maribacter sp. MMG018]MBQ4915408.1 DUF4468 domain-containing protein [Maribacter sp. MMG018]
MKKALLLFLLPFFTFSQIEVDSVNKTIFLKEINKVNLSQKEIREKVLEWAAMSFNNVNYVTRLNTEDKFIAKGIFQVESQYNGNGISSATQKHDIDYTLDVAFKEGKYKVEITTGALNQAEFPQDLFSYFMNFEDYQKYWIKYYENYQGAGKKMALKRMKNTKSMKKMYDTQKKSSAKIFDQIKPKMLNIYSSLVTYINQKTDDDW